MDRLGYRMPAEWELHEATWLSWPHNPETWQGRQKFVFGVWIQMIKALHVHEKVHLLVNDESMEKEVRERLEKADIDFRKVRLHRIPTNDCWIRDNGPTFVKNGESVGMVGWTFNSWGKKWPPWDSDQKVPEEIEKKMNPLPFLQPGIVMEGGSIEVNGQGMLLTTESCLLHPKRNPGLKKEAIEGVLNKYLGAKKIVWLASRPPVGDDTDGHIDNLARFVNTDAVVAPLAKERSNPNFESLQENFSRLKESVDTEGRPFKVIPLPTPLPFSYGDQPLPASYANFYIANGVVLLPIFNDPNDEEAIRTLRSCFPTRRVVPINCRDLVIGFGGIHCVTQQQPR